MGFAQHLARHSGQALRSAMFRAGHHADGTLSGARRLVGAAVVGGTALEKAIQKANRNLGGLPEEVAHMIPGGTAAMRGSRQALKAAQVALTAIDRTQTAGRVLGKHLRSGKPLLQPHTRAKIERKVVEGISELGDRMHMRLLAGKGPKRPRN